MPRVPALFHRYFAGLPLLAVLGGCDPVALLVNFEPSPPVAENRPVFPLRVGDRWTWTVWREVGAGPRIFLIQTQKARTEHLGTWTLAVEQEDAEGRFRLRWTRDDPGENGETGRREQVLTLWERDGTVWMDGAEGPMPAIAVERPPMPLSVEEAPCIVHFLDDLAATCSPAPGGPLDVAPGPHHAVLFREADRGRTLAQWVVGLATVGLVIPGNQTATTRIGLQRWEPAVRAPGSERLAFARKYSQDWLRKRAFEGGINREEAVAIVHLAAQSDDSIEALADAAVAGVAPAERPSVIRALLPYLPGTEPQLRFVARHTPFATGTPKPLEASVITALSESDRAAAEGLVRGRWAAYRAMLLAGERSDLPRQRAALYTALTTHRPEREEAKAIAEVFPDDDAALSRLLDALSPDDRVALAQARANADGPPSEDPRDATSDAVAQVDPATVTDAQATSLIAGLTYDTERLDAAQRLVDAAPPHRKVPLLEVGLNSIIESQQLELIARVAPGLPSPADAWTTGVSTAVGRERAPAARALLAGQWPVARAVLAAAEPARLTSLNAAMGLSGREEAFAVLDALPAEQRPQGLAALARHLQGADRAAVVTHVCAAEHFDDRRQRVLEENLDLAASLSDSELKMLFNVWSFDTGVAQAIDTLLGHAPAERRGDILVVGITEMRFDDARMQLLQAHPGLVAALTPKQRSRILKTFDFDRKEAMTLLSGSR